MRFFVDVVQGRSQNNLVIFWLSEMFGFHFLAFFKILLLVRVRGYLISLAVLRK